MSASNARLCPFCLAALIGTAFLLGVPGLADASTPFGSAGMLLLWIPSACALLRQGMRRAAASRA